MYGLSYRLRAVLQLAFGVVWRSRWTTRGWWTHGMVEQVMHVWCCLNRLILICASSGRYSLLTQLLSIPLWGTMHWQGFKRGVHVSNQSLICQMQIISFLLTCVMIFLTYIIYVGTFRRLNACLSKKYWSDKQISYSLCIMDGVP